MAAKRKKGQIEKGGFKKGIKKWKRILLNLCIKFMFRRVSDCIFHQYLFGYWKKLNCKLSVIGEKEYDLDFVKRIWYSNIQMIWNCSFWRNLAFFDGVPTKGHAFTLFRLNVDFWISFNRPFAITTMSSEEDRQRVPQENMTRLSGISRHNMLVQDCVGA